MIQHIVLFRFKPDTADDRVTAAGMALVGMLGQIPEIHAIRWVRNQGPSAAEWPWVLTVEVEDMDALQRYTDHPIHQEVVRRYLAPHREARLALDVEA